jgi:hypothetical protein
MLRCRVALTIHSVLCFSGRWYADIATVSYFISPSDYEGPILVSLWASGCHGKFVSNPSYHGMLEGSHKCVSWKSILAPLKTKEPEIVVRRYFVEFWISSCAAVEVLTFLSPVVAADAASKPRPHVRLPITGRGRFQI